MEAQIGNTPLLRLRRVARGLPAGVDVLVKAEHLNPGGSVKDRAALAMILDGERSGRLYPGKTILDATSGNTGIAYAMIGALRRYPVTLCLPKNASEERKRILRIHGAELIETDPLHGTDGGTWPTAIRKSIFIPINTTTTRTGGRIMKAPVVKSGNRLKAA